MNVPDLSQGGGEGQGTLGGRLASLQRVSGLDNFFI